MGPAEFSLIYRGFPFATARYRFAASVAPAPTIGYRRFVTHTYEFWSANGELVPWDPEG